MKYMIFFSLLLLFYSNCQTPTNPENQDHVMPLVETIVFDDISFTVCTINPNDFELKMISNVEHGIQTIKELGDSLYRTDKQLLFATNGGIFSKGFVPSGLFINDGKAIKGLNEREGAGNFHLMPNGVFCQGENGLPFVTETKKFKADEKTGIKLGIQSGPMLVIDNDIHPAFRKGSENVHIRNGVGVNAKGEIVFAISNSKTNFYSFGSLFRDELDCDNALYLDGFISEMYVHQQSKEEDVKRKFATIFYLEGK